MKLHNEINELLKKKIMVYYLQVMHESDSKEIQSSVVHEEHGRMKNVMHLRERKRRKPAWRELKMNVD